MSTNQRNISKRRSKSKSISDGDIKVANDLSVARSHSTFDNIFTWLKKRRKVIGSHQSQSEDDVDALELERSSSSLSTVKMNDQYRSSTSLKNLVDDDNDDVATSVSEAEGADLQSCTDDTDTDDALDDSLSTVKMSELVLSSSKSSVRLVHEALEYERCLRTQTVRKS